MDGTFYKQLISELPIGYAYHRIICDDDGIPIDYEFLDINSAFESFTGLKREDILGKRVSDIIPDMDSDTFDWISFYGNIALGGPPRDIEQFSKPLNKWYKIYTNSPERGFFVTYFTDITAEKLDLERKLSIIVASSDVVFELDNDYKFRDIIASDSSHLFFSKGKVLGKSIYEILPESLSNLFVLTAQKSKNFLEKQTIVYKSHLPSDDRWFKSEISFVEKNGGSSFIVSVHDITEEKKFEQKMERKKQKLDSIIRGTRTGTWEWNIQTDKTEINSRWADIIGYTVEEIIPITADTWKTLAHPEDLTKIQKLLDEHFEGKSEYYSFEFRMKHKDGYWIWVLDRGKVVSHTEDGKPLLMLGTRSDITERKNLEIQLKNERNLLKTTLLSIDEGVISIDLDGNILIINHVAEKLTGWTRKEALSSSWSDVFSIDFNSNIDPIYSVIKDKRSLEIPKGAVMSSRYGQEYPVEGSIAPVLNKDRVVNGAVIVFRDVTEKLSEQDKVMYLSYHDQLTGLYNRRFFEEELKRLDTSRNLPLGLIMIDINGLKLTNDAFGHTAGDKLLTTVSDVLKSICRSDDIVARVGGDEFAIILPNSDYTVSENILQRMYSKFSAIDLGPIIVSASAGYGTKSDPLESIDSAFKRAEDKMYKNKLNESKSMREKTLANIVNCFFNSYPSGKSHSKNVGEFSARLGSALGLDKDSVDKLRELGTLHDIGLISVDSETVNKPSELSGYEWSQVKRHSEIGYQILKSVNRLVPLAEYVLSHHERWDGEGYPDGISGNEIPLYSRILSIADAYDAMTSERSYKETLSRREAISELRDNSGTQFDPELVDIFIEKVLKARD